MGSKTKIVKGKPKKISREAIRLAKQLHKDEHFIIDGEIENNHHLKDWYYLMACQLIVELKKEIKEISTQQKYLWQTLEEVVELKKEIKEISKQQKYLWQTLEEVIETLKKIPKH